MMKSLETHLRKLKVDEDVIDRIVNVPYPEDGNPKQNAANFYAAAMRKCEELLDFDALAEVMYDRSCCKSGYRLTNAKQLAKEHGEKSMAEKLELLGNLKYMGKPRLTPDGDILSVAVGTHGAEPMTCPCWHFSGCTPAEGEMPLSYCLCCAGHFRFHYQKALGVKLRVKGVVSSIINSHGKLPCVFVFEILAAKKTRA